MDALRFMARMVVSSHRDAEPDGGVERYPFALDPEAADEPSWYVVDVLLGGVRHTYGFSVDSERVLDEWLYSYPKGRKAKVFHRSGGETRRGPVVVDLLRAADLGIENAGVVRVEVAEDLSPQLLRLRRMQQADLFGEEAAATRTREVIRIWIEQRGRHGPVKLDPRDQSEGTQVLVDYAGPVLDTLAKGGLLIVDEVDASTRARTTS